jgi:hypothetical protein
VTSSTWTWRLENAAGETVALSAVRASAGSRSLDTFDQIALPSQFPTQSDAETWVGEEWQHLLAAGVVGVTLYDGDRAVYGPMSLLPPD